MYAIDHRGHGRSGGPRALVDRMDNAVADLDALVLRAAGDHAGVPVFLLGHSMGGTVSLCYALRHQERLDGLALSGPLAALEAAPPPMRIAARVLSALAPRLPVIGDRLLAVSRDPAVVRHTRPIRSSTTASSPRGRSPSSARRSSRSRAAFPRSSCPR